MPIKIDNIFFDVDGTLVDAKTDIVNAVNFALRSLGLKAKPFDEIVSYIGTGVRDLILKSIGSARKDLIDKGVEIFSQRYVAHPTDKARLYPHAKEVLEYFNDKRKFVITNRYKKFAEITLKNLGIIKYFEEIIGGDDENCLKPSRCVLDGLSRRLKIDKEKAIIVGDMAIDIETGKNTGIKTCWVTYGLNSLEDLKGMKPDYIIDDLIELKAIIQ